MEKDIKQGQIDAACPSDILTRISKEQQPWFFPDDFLTAIIDKLVQEFQPAVEEDRKPRGISFLIPKRENVGTIEVKAFDRSNPSEFTLNVFVVRKGTDRAYNYYLKDGTREEIIAYLSDQTGFKEILGSIHRLSDSEDEYWD